MGDLEFTRVFTKCTYGSSPCKEALLCKGYKSQPGFTNSKAGNTVLPKPGDFPADETRSSLLFFRYLTFHLLFSMVVLVFSHQTDIMKPLKKKVP